MGRTGADSLPSDLSLLNPREREVYLWACAEHAAGRYPSIRRINRFLGVADWDVAPSIAAKVGWPFPRKAFAGGLKSGTHGLTPVQREILTAAWAMWESVPREDPTIHGIFRFMEHRFRTSTIVYARKVCVAKRIWPCKVRRRYPPLTDDQRQFLTEMRSGGLTHDAMRLAFSEKFRRRISDRTVSRFFRSLGIQKPYRRRPLDTVETRKVTVIAQRQGGLKIEEPSAYRRALRRGRPTPC